MCDTCGCEDNNTHEHEHNHAENLSQEKKKIEIEEPILKKNQLFAEQNRKLFQEQGIIAINLISSPGSGKTTLLEKTLMELKDKIYCAVIEGDQKTSRDAERIEKTGVPVVQINTISACHLDAHQIQHALEKLPLDKIDILFIENVGNLICPASFDLGETFKIALLSVTEGEDKPIKYPLIFQQSNKLVITKIDLLPYLNFDLLLCKKYARMVNPQIEFFEVSALTSKGMDKWINWLLSLPIATKKETIV